MDDFYTLLNSSATKRSLETQNLRKDLANNKKTNKWLIIGFIAVLAVSTTAIIIQEVRINRILNGPQKDT